MTTHADAPTSTVGADIPAVVAGLRATYATGRTRDIEWRRQQLRALERLVVDNEAAAIEPEPEPESVDPDEGFKVIGPLRISIPLFNIYLNEADEQSRPMPT